MALLGPVGAAACAGFLWSAVATGVVLGVPALPSGASGANDTGSQLFGDDPCKKIVQPSVVFLGMRSTGTSLAMSLQEHPDLSFGSRLQHGFFSRDKTFEEKAGIASIAPNIKDSYFMEFQVPCNVKCTFDATENQVMLGQSMNHSLKFMTTALRRTPRRMLSDDDVLLMERGLGRVNAVRDLLGSRLKFLVMIRHPLKVAFAMQQTEKPFEWGWAYCNSYVAGLGAWMSVFPREQFYFLRYSDFLASPARHLAKLHQFMGVEPLDTTPNTKIPKQENLPSAELLETFDMQNQECSHRLQDMSLLQLDWGTGHSQAAT